MSSADGEGRHLVNDPPSDKTTAAEDSFWKRFNLRFVLML